MPRRFSVRGHPRSFNLLFGGLLLISGLSSLAMTYPITVTSSIASTGPPATVVNIMAHADDELALSPFPLVLASIESGAHVATVSMTAGDSCLSQSLWSGRELGQMAAYRQMASSSGHWINVQFRSVLEIIPSGYEGQFLMVESR